MTAKRNDLQRLDALMDALCEDIINIPDNLITKEIEAEGLDVKKESKRIEGLINSTLGDSSSVKGTLFDATKAALEKFKSTKMHCSLPDTAEERRELLQKIMTNNNIKSNNLTLAFRDVNELSDNDVQGILEDLIALDKDPNNQT